MGVVSLTIASLVGGDAIVGFEANSTIVITSYSIHYTKLYDLDLARPETLAAALDALAPDVLINCAAYTAVDRAESEPELAFAVNAAAPGALAAACAARGVPMFVITSYSIHYTKLYDPEPPCDIVTRTASPPARFQCAAKAVLNSL